MRVWLRGGRYELSETLVFTPEDSGSADCPMIYAAYPGETVSLSGGRRITEWAVAPEQEQTCWVAEVPEAVTGAWFFTQLFVNGERRGARVAARLPADTPEFRLEAVVWSVLRPGAQRVRVPLFGESSASVSNWRYGVVEVK